MNIIITGASKGIGYELVKIFAKNKSNTIIALARNHNLLDQLKNECNNQNSGGHVIAMPFDLENPNHVKKQLKKEICKHIHSVDILINNAGNLVNKPFEELSIEEMETSFHINTISPAVIIQELIPLLQKSGNAHVVNISSMAGFQGSSKFPGLSIYSSSKAAIASLTECLAEEYKDQNITFNALALGAVNTEMLAEAFPDLKAPLNADEMASFIGDFALNGHKYFKGKILPVNLSTP
jgi:short-subunit dehydrogenase